MNSDITIPDCFEPRLEQAGRHVDRGEWASGVAIASRLLNCASQTKCPIREICSHAAERMIVDIRRLVAA